MSRIPSSFESAIQEAMAEVRGAGLRPDTAEAVDETLRSLRESAESIGQEALAEMLRDAEAAFQRGEVKQTLQRLSRSLLLSTQSPPATPSRGR